MKQVQTAIQTNGVIGGAPVRVDALLKVTGRARYGADQPIPEGIPGKLAYAALRTSPIARGSIDAIHTTAARAMPGVLDVLTWQNVGGAVKPGKTLPNGGYNSHTVTPLASNRIFFSGQIVAVVIAETEEQATAAAEALELDLKPTHAAATMSSPGAAEVEAKSFAELHLEAGDLAAGFSAAAATVDAWYETPANHHNPLELFQATCAWGGPDGDELTVWETSQNVRGFQFGVAAALGIKPAKVQVVSPFAGGAFGSRGELGPHTPLIALAAKRLGRPVKLVSTREQSFTLRTFRAETRHHLRLGADAAGHLTALEHESWELTSRSDRFATAGSDSTSRLYAVRNVKTQVHNVETDRQAPGFMRAPPEVPYLFAMESAMDELAYELAIDPLDLRRRNDTQVELATNRPYTSRSLVPCIDRGAELFGWAKRTPEPRSMATAGELVGYGYATATYPTQMGPADCTVTLTPDGCAIVEAGAHEIGTGVRTVLAQTAADALGLPLESVEVHVGNSRLPAVPLAGGSNSTASICTVVWKACERLRHRLARAALDDRSGRANPFLGSGQPLANQALRLQGGKLVAGNGSSAGERAEPIQASIRRAARGKALVQKSENTPHGLPPVIGQAIVRKGKAIIVGGAALKDRMQFAFGAQFVEVRIDRHTGEIRVPRMVGVFAAGRIMNRRTAWAQLNGGQVWGLSSALLEATEIDLPRARFVNQNLAEYQMPVNADIVDVQTEMIDEVDTLINPLGIKGVGELGITGVNAAIANAVFHASGVRFRKLPIRVGDLNREALQR